MHIYAHNDSLQQSSVECFSIPDKLCVSDSFIDHRALKITAGTEVPPQKKSNVFKFCGEKKMYSFLKNLQ